MEKQDLWDKIRAALGEIEEAVDLLEGVELSEDNLDQQVKIIKTEAQKIRSVVHDYVKPGG